MRDPKYLPVAAMYEQVTGYRPSPPTVYRWMKSGLDSWMINGKRMTTREAVQKFIELSTARANAKMADAASDSTAELDRELSNL